MGFDDELLFEQALIKELTRNGWSDRILEYPSEDDLIDNWADILFANNRGIDRLNDQPLTKRETDQLLEQIRELGTPLALNSFINGKTVSITRDNENDPLHLGKEVSLTIYDRHEIAAGKSRYQIARQPRYKNANHILPKRRGDITLLINGLPVIHVELKSSKVPAIQAANQIEKYSHEGVFSGLFSLIQIFVAMNPEEMLYFANPGQDGIFNRNYYFHWADSNNEPINDWRKIATLFLSIPMAHQMIGYYTVADQADGVLKVLRSYQYYAANAISNKVQKTRWHEGNQRGGYIWHTTGSGKTMTSFKSAQLIANSGDADKVVFLADRIELGTQSLDEYRSFAEASEDVQATESTDVLVSKLKNSDVKNTLIVTSIQKMSRVNEEQGNRRAADIAKIRKKRIVFIVDECHRSTFGDMLKIIKATFPNALFFGFTGTPIQDENQKKMNTTSTVFGDELHRYSIADGIRDKNVLGFDIYKVLTYKDRDLRKAVGLEKAKTQSEEEALADEKKRGIYLRFTNSSTVPMAGSKTSDGSYVKGIEDYLPNSQYNRVEHHRAVVKDIKEGWTMFSQLGKFHALLATESIPEAIAYYRLFKEEMPDINITALFDPNIDNTGGEEFKSDGLVEIIDDYNQKFGKTFSIPSHAAFKKDIAARLAHKKPYCKIANKPQEQINILIVVDQMLTGFDSKWINTLYIDKMLVYENIIQAFSRTNRLFGPDKPFGTIRYYRRPHTMERNINQAIELYSGNKPLGLFADPLPHNLQRLNEIFSEIRYLFEHAGINGFEKLPDDTSERGRFASLFRQFNNYLEAAKIQGFCWDKSHYRLKDNDGKSVVIDMVIDELTFKILAKRYKELFTPGSGGGTEDVPYDVDPYLTEIDTGQIDTDYMNSRFDKYLKVLDKGNATEEERMSVLAELHKAYAILSQEEQKYANIFLHDVESGDAHLESDLKFKDYVVGYMNRAKDDRIHKVASLLGADETQLRSLIMADVTPDNLNDYNRFKKLKETVDKTKAKAYLESREGATIAAYRLSAEIDSFLKSFIFGELNIE